MQGILARFRAWVRVWLGIDQLATRNTLAALEAAARTRHLAILANFAELEKQNDRHKEVILAKLKELNMRLTVAKVDHPSQYQPQVYDWDTVQAIAAHALETSEAPKEEELV